MEDPKLVDDDDPNSYINENTAILISNPDGIGPFSEEQTGIGRHHNMSFIQQFQPVGPSIVERPESDVIGQQVYASIEVYQQVQNKIVIPEHGRESQKQSSATEKHNDMLGGVLVDHVGVQSAELGFEVRVAQPVVILLDQKI